MVEYQLYRRSTFDEAMGKRCREKNGSRGMQTDMKRRGLILKLCCYKNKTVKNYYFHNVLLMSDNITSKKQATGNLMTGGLGLGRDFCRYCKAPVCKEGVGLSTTVPPLCAEDDKLIRGK